MKVIMKHQKEPVPVRAFQWQEDISQLPDWIQKQGNIDIFKGELIIETKDSWLLIIPGDYLVERDGKVIFLERKSFESIYTRVN